MGQTCLPGQPNIPAPVHTAGSLSVPLWCFVSRLQEGLILVFWDEVPTSLPSRYLPEGVSVQLYAEITGRGGVEWSERRALTAQAGGASFAGLRRRS